MTTQRSEPRILVVNASLELLNIFHEVLDGEGYEVEISNYTFEGLASIQQLNPDLIILDFDREGQREEWELLKMIRLHEATAHIPLIVSIAPLYLLPQVASSWLQKNILVLFSPFQKDDLLAAVRQQLGQSHLPSNEE